MSARTLQYVGAALALTHWSLVYHALENAPVLFGIKALFDTLVLSMPAAIYARVKRDPASWRLTAALGALVVPLGQWAHYTQLPELGTGDPIGIWLGFQEVLWDLSFQGAPGTMYGGMLIVGGLGALIVKAVSPAAVEADQ